MSKVPGMRREAAENIRRDRRRTRLLRQRWRQLHPEHVRQHGKRG